MSSYRSYGVCGAASRSTSGRALSGGGQVCGSHDPLPRSSSAARPPPRGRWPPGTWTCTSPGASRPSRSSEKIDWIRGLAEEQGRTSGSASGCTPSRGTPRGGLATAHWLLDGLDPETVAAAQQAWAASESRGSSGCWRCTAAARRRGLEISPNLWAGVGLVRGGAGTALVGSHAEVADRIEEYHALGIEQFVLSGYPHLEEAYWFGEGVMPRLRDRGLLDAGTARTSQQWRRRPDPFGLFREVSRLDPWTT